MIYAWCVDVFHDIGLGNQTLAFSEVPFVPPVTDIALPQPHLLSIPVIDKLSGLFVLGGDILQGGGRNTANALFGTSGTAADWSAAIQHRVSAQLRPAKLGRRVHHTRDPDHLQRSPGR